MGRHAIRWVLAVAWVLTGAFLEVSGDNVPKLENGRVWLDERGYPINAHGGGVIRDGDAWYWFGEHKIYGQRGNKAHVGVHCYSSRDLARWTDKGIVLAVSDVLGHDLEDGCIIERPKVLKCPQTGKYVMYFHLELKGEGYDAARTGIAVADAVQGPYRFLRSMRPNGQMSRDMALFADDDGSAYHIFASESNATLRIVRLADDYLSHSAVESRIAIGDFTEAPAICKKDGWYYMLGSGCTGWKPNTARLYRSRSMFGTWERLGNPCTGVNPLNGLGPDKTWGGQSTFILKVSDELFVAMFDIWNPDNAIDGRYVWGQIRFKPDHTLEIPWQNHAPTGCSSLVFVPAGAQTRIPPVSDATSALPQGAKEFTVDAPRNTAGLTLYCADYGVSETNSDNTTQLRAAFADAKEKGASRLVLTRGRYALNTDSPLTLEDFRDFTFDGGGSVFVSYRHGGAFLCLRRSLRTKFMNFALDWDWSKEPLASLVRVRRVDAKSYDLEFADYADFPNKKASLVVLSAYDPKTRSVGIEDGITRYLDMGKRPKDWVKRTWLDGRTVRVENEPCGIAVGQLYRLQHHYYHFNGFSLENVEHLQLENVTVLSTPGHAFAMSGKSHHVAFDHVNIVPPKDDPKRVITCTADHFHIAQSRGFVKLENCEFSFGADDIVNMHDSSAFVHRTGPRTVRALKAWVLSTARKGDRIEFRNGDYSPTGFFGTFVEARRIPGRRDGFDVTFAEDVPAETKDGFILFNWAFDTRNIIVRNCNFHDNRARGLLILARDVTVENNVFRHQEMGAIKIETGYTCNLWSEGYGVSNVVIRGNLFDTVNPSGNAASHRQRSIYTGIYLRTDPSPDTTDYPIIRDILIEGNAFRDNTGVTAYLSSVSNVVVRNNIIDDPTPRRKELPYRSQFFLTNARDVKIVGNVYRSSSNVQSPGVVFDSVNSSGIVVEGNRVE